MCGEVAANAVTRACSKPGCTGTCVDILPSPTHSTQMVTLTAGVSAGGRARSATAMASSGGGSSSAGSGVGAMPKVEEAVESGHARRKSGLFVEQ